MALSAAYIAMQGSSTVTRMWISLAARYMTQAALEQYLVYGEKGSQALLEAFAWGFDERLVADEDSDQWKTNAMFWAVDADFEGWDNVIGTHLRAVSQFPK